MSVKDKLIDGFIDKVIAEAEKAYPENSYRDIDGDYHDANERLRQAWAEGYIQAIKNS